jgi:uncharacterized 2Fe-2S/4Fe-4S cluster protein (DUF4445 family)
MADITASPQSHRLHLSKGQTLIKAAAAAHIALRTDCGGAGKCGRCRIHPAPGARLSAPTEAEFFHLAPFLPVKGIRLACQTRSLCSQTVSVAIPEDPGAAAPFPVVHGRAPSGLRTVGVAIDLGTTSVDLSLCDPADGSPLVSVKGGNRQQCFGYDVVARIAAAGDAAIGLGRLRKLAVDSINHLLETALAACGLDTTAVSQVAVAGNTTMSLILAGIDPQPLGRYPYRSPVTTFPPFTAGQLNLSLPPETPVRLFPVASGFIGGDTVSALFALEPFTRGSTTLLVDIGTNGELVLCRRQRLLAASCATGPAFEGAAISCGMPAVAGAIDHLTIDPLTGTIDWQVIGPNSGNPPAGICGSGIVDAVAGLLAAGALTTGGLFNPASPLVTPAAAGGAEAVLVPADKSRHGRALSLTQKDIGEVQLAKAAICTGIELLLARSGTRRIHRTLLTGAFGVGFDSRLAFAIGMLPPQLAGSRVQAVSALAGKGVRKALAAAEDFEAAARATARAVEVLELGGDPMFEKRFIERLAFPAVAAGDTGAHAL